VTGGARIVRLGIRVHADRAETALADLLPLLGAGCEERDLGGSVEYAIYLPEAELPPPEAIRGLSPDAVLGTITEPVTEDWERRYLAHLRRIDLGRISIRPPWLDGDPGDIVIDPGTTFGAGTHESTRLALELLLDQEPGGALCDWGAGSGVLAITAARLGFDPVEAVEIDEEALAVIEANAAANGVRVLARVADLRAEPPPIAATVTANLTPALHHTIGPRLAEKPARLIASGMLEHYAGELERDYGMREIARRREGPWAAVVMAP
jgi:ribosomal protein L11 methyltransferase